MSLIHKLMWHFRRASKEAELRDELQFHLEEEAQERIQDGLAPDEARFAARRDLGNVTLLEEKVRAVWIWRFWEELIQDVRYAVRIMTTNKVFCALVVLSLTLGIGANTALFSFMDSLLLRSLPVSDPDSLVILQWRSPTLRQGNEWRPSVLHSLSGTTYRDSESETAGIFPYPAFELFRKNDLLFSSVFAYHAARELNVITKGQANVVRGEYVSGDYFSGLGVQPISGRMIQKQDDDAASPAVAVVSAKFGQLHFGGAADATGQTILINNAPIVVIGVAPPSFFGVDPSATPDVYLPIHASIAIEASDPFGNDAKRYLDKNDYWIEVMARLRPGVTREQAQTVLAPQFHQWAESTITEQRERETLPSLNVQQGGTGVESLRRQYSKPLYMLMTLAGLILAIACANIANLLLARATARQKEMALRLSLGAGRLRLVRQLLTESVMLAGLGGGLGAMIAIWGVRSLTTMLSNGRPDFTLHADLNWHVLGVTLALSIFSGILFGIVPALRSTRVDIVPALKKIRSGESVSRTRLSLSHGLVVCQISLSLLMLVAAGLFARTLSNLKSVELGFNQQNVLLFQLDAAKADHKDPEIATFYGDLLQRFRTVPGVVQASLSHESLIQAGSGLLIHLPGAKPDPSTRYLCVGPHFFKTMQIPIPAGRDIDDRDQTDSPKVAIISDLFARINFGDQNPLGHHIILENGKHVRDMEIVGISRAAHYGRLNHKTPPVVYIPYNQGYPPPRSMTYELRTAGSNPLTYMNTVREIVHQADSRVPVTDVRTQVADINQTISQEITIAKLCTGFAVLALLIACVGLYGTVSYNVARRTSEIGIRMALGAQGGLVAWIVLREVVVLASLGLAIGLPAALGAARLVRSFLFGLEPNDPLALTMAAATLACASVLAAYLPARKATRIDPMIALRHE